MKFSAEKNWNRYHRAGVYKLHLIPELIRFPMVTCDCFRVLMLNKWIHYVLDLRKPIRFHSTDIRKVETEKNRFSYRLYI